MTGAISEYSPECRPFVCMMRMMRCVSADATFARCRLKRALAWKVYGQFAVTRLRDLGYMFPELYVYTELRRVDLSEDVVIEMDAQLLT